MDIDEQIRKLDELKALGVITEKEHREKKDEFLSAASTTSDYSNRPRQARAGAKAEFLEENVSPAASGNTERGMHPPFASGAPSSNRPPPAPNRDKETPDFEPQCSPAIEQATSDEKFYVRTPNGQVMGPYGVDELQRMQQAGMLPLETELNDGVRWRKIAPSNREMASTPGSTTHSPGITPTAPLQALAPNSSVGTSKETPLHKATRPSKAVAKGRPSDRTVILLALGGALVFILVIIVAFLSKELTEDPCNEFAGCSENGECASVEGYKTKDNKVICRASSRSHCQESEWCRKHGFCSLVPFGDKPEYGQCSVTKAEDCRSCEDCTVYGRCVVGRGYVCRSENRVAHDVAATSTGALLLGHNQIDKCCATPP